MGDHYRPERGRAPPLADRMTFTGQQDSSRQSEFTFESKHPAPHFAPSGPANAGSRGPRRNRGGAPYRDASRRDQPESSHYGRNNTNGPRRGGYRKAAPHERALLQHRDGGSPEHILGVPDGPNRFVDVDDLSNDEEADMDVESDASADQDTTHGPAGNRKAAKLESSIGANGNVAPQWAPEPDQEPSKWSNPDPYTSLPPPNETTGVKRDVVQLIRKAKNQNAEKASANNAVAANDDFISFGDDDVPDKEDDEVDDSRGRMHIHQDSESIRRPARDNHFVRPVAGSMNDVYSSSTHIAEPYRNNEPPAHPSKGKKRKAGGEMTIVDDWLPDRHSDPTPWVPSRHTYSHLSREPEQWLHNEILDFYDFVAPKDYEHAARSKLVERIQEALRKHKLFQYDNGSILCFGSYPAGLYLPTADMDLVYASDSHYRGGPPQLDSSQKHAFAKILYNASQRLQDLHIPAQRPIIIRGAKVPIIKFKDRLTGIDVDISFENLSGVQAQATFDKWKHDYPDMIYMVALVKQFLAMRGLNEVHSGGVGGFTIICLIVNYIHQQKKPDNLGTCFTGFLEYYGKRFNLAEYRIQMNPPAVLRKEDYGVDGFMEKADRLSIQDPNRLNNNISGGSSKAAEVFRAFGAAHDTLTDRMRALKGGVDIGHSLLECVLGGNYETYIRQRHHLKSLKSVV